MGNCACLRLHPAIGDATHHTHLDATHVDVAPKSADIPTSHTTTQTIDNDQPNRENNFMKVKSTSSCHHLSTEPTSSSLSQHSPRSTDDDKPSIISNQNTFSTDPTHATSQDSPASNGDDMDHAEVVAHTVSCGHADNPDHGQADHMTHSEHTLPVQLPEHKSAHSYDTQISTQQRTPHAGPRFRRANTVFTFFTRSRATPTDDVDKQASNEESRGRTRTRSVSLFKTKLGRKDTLRSMMNFIQHGVTASSAVDGGNDANGGEEEDVFVEPLQAKLNYTRNTPISSLELCILSGDVHGLMGELKHYEKEYPPFFMEYSNELGHTLLMKAALLGHFNILRFLIGKYHLYKSAVFDFVEPSMGKDIAALLLEFVGDYLNYECLAGKSALIFACSSKQRSRMNTVRYLLDNGASVTQPKYSEHGKAPIIHAVQWKQQNLIDLLLGFGADINVQDRYNGYTPLMYAAKFNDRDLCEFLLARGADASIANKSEKTAIDLAVADECWAALLALDESKIPPNVVKLANASSPKNRWGRYSLSHSYF